jgi:hypothetical protein
MPNWPSVTIAYPTVILPFRGATFYYVPTKDPNAILYGVCEVFHEIGITVGASTNNNFVANGPCWLFHSPKVT